MPHDDWSWDFEDERKTRTALRDERPSNDAAPPTRDAARQGDGGGGARRMPASLVQIRRRRLAAGVVVLALLIALAVALAGSSGRSPSRAATSAARQLTDVAKARSHAPTEPENDQGEAVSKVLAYTPFVREGGTRGNEVALTFDDGPGPYTPEVLSVLERLHVHATFFVIGKMLRYFGAATVRAIEDGDVIGDHTETHPMLAQLSAREQYEQLFEQIARVELLRGQRPVLFRPPYGSFDATTMRKLHQLHLLMVLWSVDTNDYLQPGVETIVQRALAGAHPGAIILMHDAGGTRTQTVAALPLIINGLRARGLRPVTVPRLLMDDPPPAGLPLPSSLAGD